MWHLAVPSYKVRVSRLKKGRKALSGLSYIQIMYRILFFVNNNENLKWHFLHCLYFVRNKQLRRSGRLGGPLQILEVFYPKISNILNHFPILGFSENIESSEHSRQLSQCVEIFDIYFNFHAYFYLIIGGNVQIFITFGSLKILNLMDVSRTF